MSSIWIRINGYPATEIGAHSPPTWEMGAGGGCLSATFAFALSRRAQHQALRPRAIVEILCGPVAVWKGLLQEPDRSTWEIHATGLAADLREYLALDNTGTATRNFGAAITEAAVRGWPGSNAASVVGTAAGDANGNPVSVGTLLDDYAEQTGQRWGVNGRGVIYMRPDPVVPTLLAAPGSLAFSPANENAPKRLAGRYFDGTVNQTVFVGTGAPEEAVDLTDRGPLTLPAAQAILEGMMARRGDTAWVGSATLTREQLTTIGGQPANLASNLTGQLLRAHGISEGVVTGAAWQQVVVGKTTFTANDESIVVEPINSAPRTLVDVIAAS